VWPDHFLVTCLVLLALWILISGIDDLFVSAVFFLTRKPFRWPHPSRLVAERERRIAILVPLWREHRVIGRMLAHNLASIRYCSYDIFVGVYPNDDVTTLAVREAARRYPNVHAINVPHAGPTSKGDCLNWTYRGMADFEKRRGVRFDIVMTHDAEDLVHPDSLRLVNWYARDYQMVQVPVLPLPTPTRELLHGIYCDEFAEFQTKDIPVRQRLGGFLPANGVGTGFGRDALEHLAATRGGQIFDPACLTEDYENGLRLHALGYRQIFLPLRFQQGKPVATREYFPRTFHAAVRQRSRWVAGITLQGWQHHGWRGNWREVYWFWRDRKGLVGNLLSPFANLAFLAGLFRWPWHGMAYPGWVASVCGATCSIAIVQMAIRAWCAARIYGWRFAAAVPLRTACGNVVNFCATVAAVHQFTAARLHRVSMAWRKTDHVYPKPRLGEILVRLRALEVTAVEAAAAQLPRGVRLGEYLIEREQLPEDSVYRALSLQFEIPLGPTHRGEIDRTATRILPAATARRWNVLPYRVRQGKLHVATSDVPSPRLKRELARMCRLEIRYHLVGPGRFQDLVREYLP